MARQFPIITAKLAPPVVPLAFVSRPSLVRRLEAGLKRRLTLIVAPAGMGKSVLLADWHLHNSTGAGRAVAWLALDSSDQSAARTAHHLVAACANVRAGFGKPALAALDNRGNRLGDGFIAAFLEEAPSLGDAVIVLQDLDMVANKAILDDLGTIVMQLPREIHVVVAARADPQLPLHLLRSQGQLLELRQADLALSVEEAAELVRQASGRELSESQIDVLHRRTEGWPTGVVLAGAALREVDDADEFIASFAGDNRHVGGHLFEETVERLPQDLQRFLIETSVLDRFNSDLCEAVTGRSDGQSMLDELAARNLFVIPLDTRNRWFRYHRLFASMLRSRLAATDGGAESKLLRRAADWHLTANDVEEACEYLLRAGSWNELVDLVKSVGLLLHSRGEAGVLLRWLGAVPAEEVARPIELRLLTAFSHITVGEMSAASEILDRLLIESRDTGDVDLEAIVSTFRLMGLDVGEPVTDYLGEGERVLALLEEVASPERVADVFGLSNRHQLEAIVLGQHGRGLYHAGTFPLARLLLKVGGEELLGEPSLVPIRNRAALADLEVEVGHLDDGLDAARRALSMARDHDVERSPGLAEAFLARGRVLRERNLLAEAEVALVDAVGLGRSNGRLLVYAAAHSELALLRLAQGRVDEGMDEIDQIGSLTSGRVPIRLNARVAVAAALLHLADGDPARAERRLNDQPALPGVVFARTVIAAARNDAVQARKLSGAWPIERTLRAEILRLLSAALVHDLNEERDAGLHYLRNAVRKAEPEGFLRTFLDAGPTALGLIRALNNAEPSAYLAGLCAVGGPSIAPHDVPTLVEHLTDKELLVLAYLPRRLAYEEIADLLMVSVNTVKTHLKHVYRKLDVSTRSDAVEVARRLGLV